LVLPLCCGSWLNCPVVILLAHMIATRVAIAPAGRKMIFNKSKELLTKNTQVVINNMKDYHHDEEINQNRICDQSD